MRVFGHRWNCLLAGLICASGPTLFYCAPASTQEAASKETASKKSSKVVALTAIAGEKLELACETSAIGMDFTPFKVSKGILKIVLSFKQKGPAKDNSDGKPSAGSQNSDQSKDMSDPAIIGTWTSSIASGDHEASLGVTTQKLCKEGCLLRSTPEGNMELWAPAPIMPEKLKDDETLTLASLDATTLELKATAFRGQKLSVLEKGTCRISKP